MYLLCALQTMIVVFSIMTNVCILDESTTCYLQGTIIIRTFMINIVTVAYVMVRYRTNQFSSLFNHCAKYSNKTVK